jgi:hypothetical protein
VLRKKATAAVSAKAAAFQKLPKQRLPMPPLEKAGKSLPPAAAQDGWGSEAGVRQIVQQAGGHLWNMPNDGNCAFHMYAR